MTYILMRCKGAGIAMMIAITILLTACSNQQEQVSPSNEAVDSESLLQEVEVVDEGNPDIQTSEAQTQSAEDSDQEDIDKSENQDLPVAPSDDLSEEILKSIEQYNLKSDQSTEDPSRVFDEITFTLRYVFPLEEGGYVVLSYNNRKNNSSIYKVNEDDQITLMETLPGFCNNAVVINQVLYMYGHFLSTIHGYDLNTEELNIIRDEGEIQDVYTDVDALYYCVLVDDIYEVYRYDGINETLLIQLEYNPYELMAYKEWILYLKESTVYYFNQNNPIVLTLELSNVWDMKVWGEQLLVELSDGNIAIYDEALDVQSLAVKPRFASNPIITRNGFVFSMFEGNYGLYSGEAEVIYDPMETIEEIFGQQWVYRYEPYRDGYLFVDDASQGVYMTSDDQRNKILDQDVVNIAVYEDRLYFSLDKAAYPIMVLNIETGEQKAIGINGINFKIFGDQLYFLNTDDGYCLYRYDIKNLEIVKLTEMAVSMYDITTDYLAYLTTSLKPELWTQDLETGVRQFITQGNIQDFIIHDDLLWYVIRDDADLTYEYDLLTNEQIFYNFASASHIRPVKLYWYDNRLLQFRTIEGEAYEIIDYGKKDLSTGIELENGHYLHYEEMWKGSGILYEVTPDDRTIKKVVDIRFGSMRYNDDYLVFYDDYSNAGLGILDMKDLSVEIIEEPAEAFTTSYSVWLFDTTLYYIKYVEGTTSLNILDIISGDKVTYNMNTRSYELLGVYENRAIFRENQRIMAYDYIADKYELLLKLDDVQGAQLVDNGFVNGRLYYYLRNNQGEVEIHQFDILSKDDGIIYRAEEAYSAISYGEGNIYFIENQQGVALDVESLETYDMGQLAWIYYNVSTHKLEMEY